MFDTFASRGDTHLGIALECSLQPSVTKTKFYENPFTCLRVVAHGLTDVSKHVLQLNNAWLTVSVRIALRLTIGQLARLCFTPPPPPRGL